MILNLHGRSPLCIIAAFALSSCGGDETPAPPPVAAAPTPTPPPTPTPTGSQSTFTLLEDIQYGQGTTEAGSVDLLLDIYQPEATCTAPRPTIFYVHGGGFILGDKQDSLVAAIAPRVTAAGFNFVSINYRLAGDNPVLSPAFAEVGQAYIDDGTIAPDAPLYVPIMASFEDGVTALNWMEDNAAQYCFDISRLGYWGSSAGTFVTLQIAYALDQFDIERPEPRFVNAWWGVLLRDADLEAGEAPFLILHGEQDPVVPYRDSEELAARAEDVGVPYAFYTLLGAGHGFDTGNEAQTLAGIELSVRFAVDHLTDATPTYGRFDVP
ncbi:alpha/beta hydrolase [Erythrobacter sp. EC-HK427]|uniref:alpha/beta hydrolase n=1 Tax=Erythrobacter sp. EC-HK427 TaxID=2038396 RepID=UPI00125ACD21|nr:alpha/beta hydrolase [Erythrobacter sp. EC-HK427]VVT00341.1 Esterase/lipase [Erythrobacter sp. EC-HK427]